MYVGEDINILFNRRPSVAKDDRAQGRSEEETNNERKYESKIGGSYSD